MTNRPAPDLTAPSRHTQECRNSNGLTLADLHRLAGKWDKYPPPATTAPLCPICAAPLKPLTVYCGRACQNAAYKRSYRGAAKRREADVAVEYSFPPPRKGQG